jgi:hypothetical protein
MIASECAVIDAVDEDLLLHGLGLFHGRCASISL